MNQGTSMDILAIVGAAVSVITLLALVGGGFYWWGRLSSRVDALAEDVKALRNDVQSVRGEVQSVRNELLTEMRQSEDRILTALTRHSHVSPEAGPPVFWQPIGMADPANPPSREAPMAARDPGGR